MRNSAGPSSATLRVLPRLAQYGAAECGSLFVAGFRMGATFSDGATECINAQNCATQVTRLNLGCYRSCYLASEPHTLSFQWICEEGNKVTRVTA